MSPVQLSSLTRTDLGHRLYELAERAGLKVALMHVYGRELEGELPERAPPESVELRVGFAGDLEVDPDPDFDDLRPSDRVVLAVDDGAIVGWTFLTVGRPIAVDALSATVEFDGGYVWHLYVDPAQRQRGIASALVAETLRVASDSGASSAFALVALDNAPSKYVFEATGFDRVDDTSYYRLWSVEHRSGPVEPGELYIL